MSENPIMHDEEVDLMDYFRIIYKYKWLIALIVIATMIFIGFSYLSQPQIYEAKATFFPLEADYKLVSQGMSAVPRLGSSDLIISLLESRSMMDRVIEALDLKTKWQVERISDARKILQGSMKVDADKKGVIALIVKDTSASLAAEIANAYVDNLDYFNQQLNIGLQRQIVQVIDRATVPEEYESRGTVKKTLTAGFIAFVISIFIIVFVDYVRRSSQAVPRNI